MKNLISLCVLALIGMFAWNIWSSRTAPNPQTDPAPAAEPPAPSLTPEPTPPPEPTPTPSYPERRVYLEGLAEITTQLAQDIGPAAPKELPPGVEVTGQLNELWRLGQLMHQGGALDGEEAKSVVRIITVLRDMDEQRDVYEARFEALYNRYAQRRMGGLDSTSRMTFESVNQGWRDYAGPNVEELIRRLRKLDIVSGASASD